MVPEVLSRPFTIFLYDLSDPSVLFTVFFSDIVLHYGETADVLVGAPNIGWTTLP